LILLVPGAGIEPARLAAGDFEPPARRAFGGEVLRLGSFIFVIVNASCFGVACPFFYLDLVNSLSL